MQLLQPNVQRARPFLVAAVVLLGAVAAPAAASAASAQLEIRGHGYGHGVGMSQWGAYGFAQRGGSAAEILRFYYRGTALSTVPSSDVRVLLASARRSVRVRGAVGAGATRLSASTSYVARANGLSGVVLRTTGGRVVARSDGPLRLRAGSANAPIRIANTAGFGVRNGRWRGIVELRAGTLRGVDVVEELGIEDYLRGVVATEVPASWPAQALRAQAIAARSYALTTDAGGGAFDQYPDTRSQAYEGVEGETATTDAAVAATRGQVVSYRGRTALTYFFSTSGGHTENVENSFAGATPQAYLRGIVDPYDGASPKHTWGPVRMTLTTATRRLKGLVKGRLRRVRVLERGVSPRILRAQLIGSRGRSEVSGAQLRAALGLDDTWATFRVVRG